MSEPATQIVSHDDNHATNADQATAIVQVIERAATNPNVDIDKMERLLEMQERILAREAKADFAAAFSAMQTDLPEVGERGKIHNKAGKVQSTYALWEDINEAIKPVLAKHGFSISFRVDTRDKVSITGVLSHRNGHSEETTITLPVDVSDFRNAVQSTASSVSYGKRYTAGALLNLTSRGEDDDGQKAGVGETISDDQLLQLRDLAESVDADLPRFCRYLKVDSLADLPARRFEEARKALEAKRVKS